MSVHDPKYLSLRRKLDQLKYPQTLHPDSLELVDRLVKDLFKSMTDLDKERKKKQNDPCDKNPTLTALYDQIDFLTNKNSQLSSQINELRSQSNSTKAEDKLRQFNTVLTDFKIQYAEKVNDYENTVQKLQSQISASKQQNRRLQKQCASLRNSSSQHLQQLQDNNVELASMIQKKNKEIRQLQESNSAIRIKTQVLQKNLQEARTINSTAKEDNRIQGNKIVAILKQEVADYQIRFKQARTELQLANNDTDSLKRELQRAKDELAYLRREENQAKDMQNITKIGKEKMETVFQQTRDALTQKAEECRQLASQIQDHDQQRIRLNGKLTELTTKLKFLTTQNSDLQSQIQLISAKATSHLKRARELQTENALLQKQLGSGQTKDASLLIEQVNAELRQQQTKNEALHRDLVLKERELKLLQNEVQVLREEAESAASEREKKVLENKKLQLVIGEGSKNLQIMQLQKEELMKENRQLKTGKQAISSSDAASKSELFVLRQQLQTNQLQIDEIRALLKNEQNANRDLQAQIAKLSGKLKQSQQKNRQVFEDNKLMVGQIKLLQQRKVQLYQKVKDLQQRESLQQDNHTVTRKEFQQLLSKHGELERELAKKEQIVRVMDTERDELQNQLDRETETRAALQQQLAFLEQNSRQINKSIDQRQYSLNQMERRLSKAESARDSMERQFERQCEDVLQLKDRLGKAQAAARQYENEANILALSNKEAQQQAERLRGRVSQLDRKLKDKIRENDEDRERAMALNILSTELQSGLQKQRMEVVRLEGFLKQLQEVNNSMFQHLQQKDQELQEQRYLIDDANRKQQALLHQISSYQRNLQIQANDYAFLQEELQRSERERETLRAERSWKKDINENAQDWKIKQEQRVIQLQQDYDRKRAEVDQLRLRNRQLQNLLNQQRMRSFRNTQQRTPLRTDLVQSRVQSYEGDTYSLPKRKQRMKSLSVRENSEISQSESIQSSQEKMRMIQQMYKQTIRPSVK